MQSDIRTAVETALDFPLNDAQWADVVDDGIVRDVEIEASSLQNLVTRIRARLEIWGIRPPRGDDQLAKVRHLRRKGVTTRMEAIQALSAAHASDDKEISKFRMAYLGSELLRLEDVEQWLHDQSKTDGPLTHFMEVALPEGVSTRVEDQVVVADPPVQIGSSMEDARGFGGNVRLLSYGVPDDQWRRVMAVNVDGVLEQLRSLAERLARRYVWAEAQATLYVLTGMIPVVRAAGIKHSLQRPIAATSRIVLTLDPALTPLEVASIYRKARRGLVRGRFRNLSDKHVTLAAFIAESPATEPWTKRQDRWQRRYPQWRYSQGSNFRRDAGLARDRLLNPHYELSLTINGDDDDQA